MRENWWSTWSPSRCSSKVWVEFNQIIANWLVRERERETIEFSNTTCGLELQRVAYKLTMLKLRFFVILHIRFWIGLLWGYQEISNLVKSMPHARIMRAAPSPFVQAALPVGTECDSISAHCIGENTARTFNVALCRRRTSLPYSKGQPMIDRHFASGDHKSLPVQHSGFNFPEVDIFQRHLSHSNRYRDPRWIIQDYYWLSTFPLLFSSSVT